MMLARALFGNVADTSDELSFKKDEIVQVLSRCPDGLDGWWLCRTSTGEGIAPANRLILITNEDNQNDYDKPKEVYIEKGEPTTNGAQRPRPKTADLFLEDYNTPRTKEFASSLKTRPQTADLLAYQDYDHPNKINTSGIENTGLNLVANMDYDTPAFKYNRLNSKHGSFSKNNDYDTPSADKRNTTVDMVNNNNRIISSYNHMEDYDLPLSKKSALNANNLNPIQSHKSIANEDYDLPKYNPGKNTARNINASRFKSEIIMNPYTDDYDLPKSTFEKLTTRNLNSDNITKNDSNKHFDDYDLPKPSRDHNQRPKSHDIFAQSDYDQPKSKLDQDRFTNFTKNENRDSLLAEYDVPVERLGPHFEKNSKKYPETQNTHLALESHKQDRCSSNTILDTDKYIINVEQINIAPFNASYKEVMNVVNQLPAFADKWQELKNVEARPPIVKMVAVNLWTKLQSTITNAAKLTASLAFNDRSNVVSLLNMVKDSNNSLESILDFLNTYQKLEFSKREGKDYISNLLDVSKAIGESLIKLKSLFESIQLNNKTQLENKLCSTDPNSSKTKLANQSNSKSMYSSFDCLDYDQPKHKTPTDNYRVKSYDGILEYNNYENTRLPPDTDKHFPSRAEANQENIIYRTKSLEITLDGEKEQVKRSESRYSAILMRPFHHLAQKEKRNAVLMDMHAKNASSQKGSQLNATLTENDLNCSKRKENKRESGLSSLRKKFKSLSKLF